MTNKHKELKMEIATIINDYLEYVEVSTIEEACDIAVWGPTART